ncbi:tRNA (5-methylaminomethyl-2-thiouridine)(34)-methyltransferase MnmD [Flavobacteriaceae bacterium F08102]|nr:tRNA (5-methylaminomethyl-2-thiouridine)(34)-methyltransferase MnmD [Flavobacteriaceae bacterium F08102]
MTELKREIIVTADGSTTIHIPKWNEQYHSIHGAVQEARHVYIEMGLHYRLQHVFNKPLAILEIGLGTGLNAMLTQMEAIDRKQSVYYVGVDAFPVRLNELTNLNYVNQLGITKQALFHIHSTPWEQACVLSSYFTLRKTKQLFQNLEIDQKFDLVYYDAFGARVQPELWTESMFSKMYNFLNIDGVLVTYAAKGSVRRAMIEVGFQVERLKGPPGKREMLRGIKR